MTVDIDPAGDLATAGLIAREIEGDRGKSAHGVHAGGQCLNCKAELIGTYCHQCGQPAHVHRSLLHIGEELIHGILHFDAKSWRTLPLLLVRPGLLTRRYVDGQRARYVSPLALFLFSVFVMYFTVSMVAHSDSSSPVQTAAKLQDARKGIAKDVAAAQKAVEQREAQLAAAKSDSERAKATERLDDARDDLKAEQAALTAVTAVPTTNAEGKPITGAEITRDNVDNAVVKLNLEQTHPTLARTLKHAAQNPDLTLYKLKSSAYKFAFLLVPLSLPFMWLMFFWRKGVTMYDHAIFTLYGLSFLSLWCVLLMVMGDVRWLSGLVGLASLYIPVHLFLQLKETYSLGWFSAIWRTFALLTAGSIIVVMFIMLVLVISLN
jgi:uncharacterized protein DUF3667